MCKDDTRSYISETRNLHAVSCSTILKKIIIMYWLSQPSVITRRETSPVLILKNRLNMFLDWIKAILMDGPDSI